jgi:Ferritin-like domain
VSGYDLVPGSGRGARAEAALAGKPLAEAAGSSRRGVLAGGAALAVAGALALTRPPAAAAQASDVDQLERLLALEQRLLSLYETGLQRDAVDPGLGETLLAHEREHIRGLEMALRARGRRSPRATVPPPQVGTAFASRPAFARFAIDVETETVGAYQGALTALSNTRLLLPLGSIMASGAQHVVALRQAAGDDLLAPG